VGAAAHVPRPRTAIAVHGLLPQGERIRCRGCESLLLYFALAPTPRPLLEPEPHFLTSGPPTNHQRSGGAGVLGSEVKEEAEGRVTRTKQSTRLPTHQRSGGTGVLRSEVKEEAAGRGTRMKQSTRLPTHRRSGGAGVLRSEVKEEAIGRGTRTKQSTRPA
jgi:hypothetical protein